MSNGGRSPGCCGSLYEALKFPPPSKHRHTQRDDLPACIKPACKPLQKLQRLNGKENVPNIYKNCNSIYLLFIQSLPCLVLSVFMHVVRHVCWNMQGYINLFVFPPYSLETNWDYGATIVLLDCFKVDLVLFPDVDPSASIDRHDHEPPPPQFKSLIHQIIPFMANLRFNEDISVALKLI